MTLQALNDLPEDAFRSAMKRCCGSSAWVSYMEAARPFKDKEDFFAQADVSWGKTQEGDWLEAFSHHPKIGDVDLQKKFADTAEWAGQEQGATARASEQTLAELKELNEAYEEKFGFIFIVCATGKSALEMLELLRKRMDHKRERELEIAAAQQHMITKLRMEKLL